MQDLDRILANMQTFKLTPTHFGHKKNLEIYSLIVMKIILI